MYGLISKKIQKMQKTYKHYFYIIIVIKNYEIGVYIQNLCFIVKM